MEKTILAYNQQQEPEYRAICEMLQDLISKNLKGSECKVWHAHPVWFINENPIVGYSKQKPGIKLMFWSGADFDEDGLDVRGKKFKDASVFYNEVSEIDQKDVKRWLKKGKEIQWDYKNLIKRKGKLVKL